MAREIARRLRANWLLLLILSSLLGAFVALRTRASDIDSVAEADRLLSQGQPTVMEFYSNT